MSGLSFQAAREQVVSLKELLSGVARSLDRTHEIHNNPKWNDLVSIPEEYPLHEGKPILVICLSGPSGGGKSTIFRLLTGVDVPSGSAVRPVSYNSVLAVPEELADKGIIEGQFPSYSKVIPLEDREQVRDRHLSKDNLLVAPYNTSDTARVFSLIVDIPDLNTVETSNWDKAEKMMARAELILFVTQADSYKDQRVVDVLRRCCMAAGRLVFIITKVGGVGDEVRLNAENIWADMVSSAESELKGFVDLRADGMRLCDFLGRSDVFYAPFLNRPTADDFLCLGQGGKSLKSVCVGDDAERILMAHLQQAAQGGIEIGLALCSDADRMMEELKRKQSEVNGQVKQLAYNIAGMEFPVGEFLATLIDATRQSRPTWLRVMFFPFAMLSKGVIESFRALGRLVKRLRHRHDAPELKNREELERERLAEGTDLFVDQLRNSYPSEIHDLLSNERASSIRTEYFQKSLPPAQKGEWENYVRVHAMEWARNHPVRSAMLGTLSDLLVLIGGTIVVVDLAVTGGATSWLVAATEAAGGYGLSGLILGTVMKFVEEAGISITLVEIKKRWTDQRGREIEEHLLKHFAHPLVLDRWNDQLESLRLADVAECRALCERLKEELQGINA